MESVPAQSHFSDRTNNRQLQVTGMTDQRGTVHAYGYDKLGRLLTDSVTTFGSGVSDAVSKLESAFDARGLPTRAASYNTDGSARLNEIAWDYNDFNQPVAEYQEHGGAVDKATSLKVGYSYESGSANTIRPTALKYPHVGSGSATTITLAYTSALANAIGRMDELKEGSTVLASWKYAGLSRVVAQKYPAATNTELTYGSAGDSYAGYDRFGRIVETLWKCDSTELVHSKYGRNAVGGVSWRKDVKAHALPVVTEDHFYWYDDLRQVYQHDRGDLTPSSGPPYTGIDPTTRQQQEIFGYDQTGNWLSEYRQTPSLIQYRGHNTANEITGITGPSGVVQPVYDAAGNMTTMPKPSDWTAAYTCKWDAWNRLVELKEGSTVVQTNTYDARTRRITQATASETRSYFYNRQWRSIEERVSSTIKAQHVFDPYDRWNLIRRQRSVSGTLDENLFCLRDFLDPVAIVKPDGTVEERYSYDAFGPVRKLSATFGASSSTAAWTWLFHGEFIDTETGLYNYGYRYYQPHLGKWPSRDPIKERGGVNLYEFVKNSSTGWFDYLGREPKPIDAGVSMNSGFNSGEQNEFDDIADRESDEGANRTVNTGQEVISFLKELSEDNCCIRKLTISGHGWRGPADGPGIPGGKGTSGAGIYTQGKKKFADGSEAPNWDEGGISTGSFIEATGDGSIVFCKNCTISIHACSVSVGFAKELAAATGCNVVTAGGGCDRKSPDVWRSTAQPGDNGNNPTNEFRRTNPDGTTTDLGHTYRP